MRFPLKQSIGDEIDRTAATDFISPIGVRALTDRIIDTIGLVPMLDVLIARGTKEGYSDDDYQAMYAELTGSEWEVTA